jgi:hypothetical protein
MVPGHACALLTASALALLGLSPGSASAALPAPRAHHLAHHHETPGDGWHIELTVSRDPRWVGRLVLHSERCDATVLTTRVRIRDDGSIASSKPFDVGRRGQGRWRLAARFTEPGHLEGEFQVTTESCDGGPRVFHTHTGAGSHGHGGHHQHLGGTRAGRYPNLRRASAKSRSQARRLWQASRRAARFRFPSARAAAALGYVPKVFTRTPPLLFHLRQLSYDYDDRTFDARHVESLVYWWNADGTQALIGFMYRLPLKSRASFAAPLLGWHRHGSGVSKMTHVWLTGDLRTALANCMPVAALERAIPKFQFDPRRPEVSPESAPCPER